MDISQQQDDCDGDHATFLYGEAGLRSTTDNQLAIILADTDGDHRP